MLLFWLKWGTLTGLTYEPVLHRSHLLIIVRLFFLLCLLIGFLISQVTFTIPLFRDCRIWGLLLFHRIIIFKMRGCRIREMQTKEGNMKQTTNKQTNKKFIKTKISTTNKQNLHAAYIQNIGINRYDNILLHTKWIVSFYYYMHEEVVFSGHF